MPEVKLYDHKNVLSFLLKPRHTHQILKTFIEQGMMTNNMLSVVTQQAQKFHGNFD